MKLVWQRFLFVKNRKKISMDITGETLLKISLLFLSSHARMFARCEIFPTFVEFLYFLKGENLGYQIYFLLPNSDD